MGKTLTRVFVVWALFLLAANIAFAAVYTSHAGCYQGTSIVTDSDQATSLEVGDALQYIYSGVDDTIDPPSPSGGVTGDDELWSLTGVGTDTVYGGFFPSPSPGYFYHKVTGEPTDASPQIYVRAWNTGEVGAGGSYYGNSNLFAPTTAPDAPSEVSLESFSTTNFFDFTPPAPPDPFTATPESDGDIFLSWTNTNESDFKATMIRYFSGGSVFPTNETEGTLFLIQEGGTGESRSSTHESLVWNTSYFYSAFSSDEVGNFSLPVTASATSTDLLPPTVEVFTPNGGELYAGGSVHDITWEATENGNSGFISTPITIYFTTNEGTSWTFITQEANSGSYAWTIPTGIYSTECRVSVEAEDNAGNVGNDQSDATFTIDGVSPEVSSISLYDRTTGDTDRTNEQTITVEAFGVSGDANEMIVSSEASFAGASWQSFVATFEYTVPSGDGTKEVYYKVRDAVSLESTPVSNSIILDTSGPTSTSITINNGDPYTKEVNVELTLTATDEWTPIEMIISNEASFAGANWESFSGTKAWTLPSGDGTKTVYAKFRDGGSNESGSESDTIYLDTVLPTVEVTSPDGGEIWIGGSTESITWTATDEGSGFGATPIVIWFTSNEGTSWEYITTEANSGSYSWTVPTLDSDQCRISVEATDQALNTGRDMSAATFTIDSTAPTVTSIEVVDRDTGNPLRTNERPVSVEAFGVSADAAEMRLAENSGFSVNDTGWISYAANYEYTLSTGDGSKTVYFKVRDGASQESNTVNDDIILDTTGPTGTSITINSGASYTNEVNVELTLTATDEWMPIEMIISNEASFTGANWESFSTTKSWALVSGDGSKTVYAKFRDGGSNESTTESDAITLDTAPPTVEVTSPDGGEYWAGGSVHNITWTAVDSGSGFGATPIVIWFTSNEGTNWEYVTTEANSGSYSWTLPTVDSTQCRVSVEATDQALNTGRDMSAATFTIDSASPEVSSISLYDRTTGDTDRTNEQTITVEAFGASADATQMMIAQDAGFSVNSTGWISYTATTEYSLTAGDGTKEVYYKVRDAVNNESTPVSDSIILDTTGPTGTSITINSGASYTNEANVELTLTATDEWAPIEMIISNEASFTGANWESFSTTKSWALISGDGAKTVYAKFRDGGSNESGTESDDITLDTVPPTVEVIAPDGGEVWIGGSNHNITWTANDSGSGFGATPIVIWFTSNEGASWNYVTTETNSGSYSWTLPTIDSTQCRVSVEATDQALNTGRDMSAATFTIDSTPPSVTSIEVVDRSSGNPLRTNEQAVSVEAFGVSGDATQMRLAENSGFTVNETPWITYEANYEYTLSTGDGSKTVYFKVRDAALQESNTVSDSIILDTTGPTSTSITINSGDSYTNEVNVVLSLTATDAWVPIEMIVSNEASFIGANWESFSGTKAWTLLSGDGTKTVYAKFRDGGSNESGSESDDILLDTTPPTVEVTSPDGGENWAGGSNHNITWTAVDSGSGFGAAPIVIWFTSNDGTNWNYVTTETNSGSYSWTVPTIDSTQCRVSVEATDRSLNTGRDKSAATFTIDSTAPTITSIEARDRTTGNNIRTNELAITVEAFGVSGGPAQMILAQDAAFTQNSTGWISYSQTTEYTFLAGDGTRTVHYKLRDALSLESSTVSDSIIVDTTGPTSTSITINNDDPYTNEVNVELTLTATDEWVPILMNISNEASFPEANWESFSTSKAWTLTSGDGPKTVYAKFRDGGSNESGPESDAITLDTVPPTVEVVSPDGGEVWIGGSNHNITWTANDSGSGFGATPIVIWFTSNDGGSWSDVTTEANTGSIPAAI
jgi:hypothetical protein